MAPDLALRSGCVLSPTSRRVLEAHLAALTEDEKVRLRAYADARLDIVLRRARLKGEGKTQASPPRKRTRNPVSRSLSQHGKLVLALARHEPDLAALVWGGILFIFQSGLRFPAHFKKVVRFFNTIGWILRPLSMYAESLYLDGRVVQDTQPLRALCFLITALANNTETLAFGNADAVAFLDRARVVSTDLQVQFPGHQASPSPGSQFVPTHSELATLRFPGRASLVTIEPVVTDRLPPAVRRLQSAHLQSRTSRRMVNMEANSLRIERQKLVARRTRILHRLSPLDSHAAQAEMYSLRHGMTGSWLLDRGAFRRWLSSSWSTPLWCHGKPGVGKSVLASVIVNHLQGHISCSEHAIAYEYCGRGRKEKCTSRALVSSILRQWNQEQLILPTSVYKCHEQLELAGREPTWGELCSMVLASARTFPGKIVLLDGLDECVDCELICPLLVQVGAVQSEMSGPSVKILIFSRSDHAMIKVAFEDFDSIVIDPASVKVDIEAYAGHRIDSMSDSGKLLLEPAHVRGDMQRLFVWKAEGMFLWVKLQLDQLQRSPLQGLSYASVRAAIDRFPRGLDRVYQRALDTISRQSAGERVLARKVLMWTLYAMRALHFSELLDALATQPGEQRIDAANRLAGAALITTVCAGLVTVDKWGYVNLAHDSVKAFLTWEGTGFWGPHDFHFLRNPSHVEIGQILLTYLMHDDLDIGDASSLREISFGFRSHPLAIYAAGFWADHVRGSGERALPTLVLDMLLNKRPNSSPMRILFANTFLQNSRFEGFPKDSNALHILVSNRLEYTLRRLSRRRLRKYLNEEDCDGESPLLIATRENMVSIAEFLIKARGRVHQRSPRGLDALHRVCMHGNEHLARMLLDAGADPSVQTLEGTTIPSLLFRHEAGHELDSNRLISHAGWTSLHAACYHGRTNIAKILIDANVKLDLLSEAGWNAGYEAVSNNHPRIVEQLILAGANLDLRRENGESVFALAIRLGRFTILKLLLTTLSDVNTHIESDTLLNKAALSGHLSLVDELIASGANVDAQTEDKAGFPLYSAAWKGHEEIAARLVKAGANANITKTTHYATALLAAVQTNQKAIVSLLLEAGADPKLQLEGWTIIHCATQSKSVEMVRAALSTGPEINEEGSMGRTALQNAVEEGCEVEILNLLLEAGADPHLTTGEHERTALYYAALNGHLHAVEWLLKQAVDVNPQSDTGETPLILAASNGYTAIAKLLLEHGAKTDLQNKKKRTALLEASSAGYPAIVESLIQAGAALEISDIYQFTALSLAAGNNRRTAAHLLLAAGAAVDGRGGGGWTPLMSAARSGYDLLLPLFLSRKADVRATSDDGSTAGHLAAENGHVRTLRLLVEAGALVNVHQKGRTLLFEAAKNGHLEAVRYLLSVGADPLIKVREERDVTPMHCAASFGHVQCMRELMRAGVPIDLPDKEGATCLHYAGRFGRANVIEMLLQEGVNKDLKTNTVNGCVTPLDFASMNGHVQAVHALAEAGFDVNGTNSDGVAPLHWASFFGHFAVVEYLLARDGILVNVQTRDGLTPLMDAAMNGLGPVLDVLMAAGADPLLSENNGRSPIHYAAKAGHSSLLQPLLEKGVDINLQDQKNWNPLQTACWHGHVDTMKTLVELGADPEPLYRDDLTLLHLAVQADQPKVARHLLEDRGSRPARLEARSTDAWTPLYNAAWAGKTELVQILLEAGADVRSRNFANNTALHIAADRGHAEVVSALLKADAQRCSPVACFPAPSGVGGPLGEPAASLKEMEKVQIHRLDPAGGSARDDVSIAHVWEMMNEGGETPLHSASVYGHYSVMRTLLAAGARADDAAEGSVTPLITGAKGGHLEAVRLLLDHGAGADRQTISGRTALFYASERCHKKVVKLLLRRGANPNLQDRRSRTALQRACSYGYWQIANLLLAAGADPFVIDDTGRSCEDWGRLCGADLEMDSATGQELEKRQKRDATIRNLLANLSLDRMHDFDLLGRIFTYDGRDVDAQICFERPAISDEVVVAEKSVRDDASEPDACEPSKDEPRQADNVESNNVQAGKVIPCDEIRDHSVDRKREAHLPDDAQDEPNLSRENVASKDPMRRTEETSRSKMSTEGGEDALKPLDQKKRCITKHRACCDGCEGRPRLIGIRYVCRSCEDRDLCEACMKRYGDGKGEIRVPGCVGHAFLKVPRDEWAGLERDGIVLADGGLKINGEEWLKRLRAEWESKVVPVQVEE